MNSPLGILVRLCALMALGFGASFGAESLWPIKSLPLDQIQKDWNFAPDADWVQHIQDACVKITPKGAPGGGSGAFVSPNGLIVTNRHCVVDALSELSKQGKNPMRDGLYAATEAEELACALEVHVLDEIRDVTAQVHNDVGRNAKRSRIEDLERKVFLRKTPGYSMQLVPSFGGARYDLYVYKTYDAKLVFVPDSAWGEFGGDIDNFRYPRHTLDIAFVRAYSKDAPIKSPAWFPLSASGPKDGDPLFMAGHPGKTERYLPVARMEYLRDVELPMKLKLAQQVFAALKRQLDAGGSKEKITAELKHWDNMLKIYEGSLGYLKSPEGLAERQKQETKWRTDFAALKENGTQYVNAFDEIAAACNELKADAAEQYFGTQLHSHLFGLGQSLNRFAKATRRKSKDDIAPIVKSFGSFIDRMMDSGSIDLDVEKAVFTGWLTAAKEHFAADSPFLNVVLAGRSPAEAAEQILKGAEKLNTKDSVAALITEGAASIDEARIPLLMFILDISKTVDAGADRHNAAKERYGEALAVLERGLAEIYGTALPPDASNTLRLGWGKVSGYTETGKQIPWSTTFSSMRTLADTRGGQTPFALSEKFKSTQQTVNLATPLNFVSTVDGCPGCSGAPMFSRDKGLVGVLFDGNRQEVPSIYAYIPAETGGRSIAVHSAAIWTALEKVYRADALVKELKSGGAGNKTGQ